MVLIKNKLITVILLMLPEDQSTCAVVVNAMVLIYIDYNNQLVLISYKGCNVKIIHYVHQKYSARNNNQVILIFSLQDKTVITLQMINSNSHKFFSVAGHS